MIVAISGMILAAFTFLILGGLQSSSLLMRIFSGSFIVLFVLVLTVLFMRHTLSVTQDFFNPESAWKKGKYRRRNDFEDDYKMRKEIERIKKDRMGSGPRPGSGL
jgi:uncharacterized membrane protein